MMRTILLLLAFTTLGTALPLAAEAHTGRCYDVDLDCARDCTLTHLRTTGGHDCMMYSSSAKPDVRYQQCRPPEFGYAVWVNGQQVAYCMI